MFGVDDMIMGGLSLAGGIMSNIWGDERQEKSNQFNAQQAQLNRDFQERMSNTQYQRGMEDMRKAGLNPILAYSKGGASAPSGSAASSVSPAPVSNAVENAVSSAQQSKRLNSEVAKQALEMENLKQQNINLKEQSDQIRAATNKTFADTTSVLSDVRIKEETLKQAMREGEKGEIDKELFDTKWGRIMRQIGTVGKELNPFGSTAKQLLGR